MNYDFDMIMILPLAAQRKARDTGQEGVPSGQRIALFRDHRVVEALQSADPAVQDLFLEAGFGLANWSSDMPAGRYRASEEEARQALLSRFNAGLRASGGRLRSRNWGGFSISGFTDGILSAQPMTERELRDERFPGEETATAAQDATAPGTGPRAVRDQCWPGMGRLLTATEAGVARSVWAERPGERRTPGYRALAMTMLAVTSVMGVALWQLLGAGGEVERVSDAAWQQQDF